MTQSTKNPISKRIRDIPTRFGIGLIHVVGILPYPVLVFLGKGLGLLMMILTKNRRQIAEKNLLLCFPECSDLERKSLLRENFISTGIGFMETAFSWTVSPKRLLAISEFKGKEHLSSVLETGQGAIVLGFHLTSLELGGAALGNIIPLAAMYRQHSNPLFEKAMCDGRLRNITDVIKREDVRTMIKSLKSGKAVWYAADQDYGSKYSVFAPFFNIPSATITATSRFVRLAKVPVIPMTHYRDRKTGKFIVQLYPKLDNFATQDNLADATRINHFLEKFLRQHPEDYLWVHRRFKTRPDNLPSFYKEKSIYKVRTMLESSYNNTMHEATVLEGTIKKPELLELDNGNYMKFLYEVHFLKPSPAKRYTRQWQKDNDKNITILKLFRYPPLCAEIVYYQKNN